MRAFNRNTKQFSLNDLNAMVKEMVQLSTIWFTRIQDSVFKNFDVLLRRAAESGKNEVAAAFDLPNEVVIEFVRNYVATFAKKISDTSADELSTLLTTAYNEAWSLNETRDQLLGKFRDWDQKRATMVARSETIRASNAGALFSYQEAGIEWVEWIAAEGDACPFCRQLHGTILPAGETFVNVGGTVDAEQDGVLRSYKNTYEPVNYPPLHPNCRCTIVPSEGPQDVTLGE